MMMMRTDDSLSKSDLVFIFIRRELRRFVGSMVL